VTKPFHTYLLRCADDTYYAGHTDDLDRRMAQHHTGEIDGYTSSRRPVQLVWVGEATTREEALAFEMRIKSWSRAKKEALIAGDWQRVSELSRARSGTSASTSSARTAMGDGVPLAQSRRIDSATPAATPTPTSISALTAEPAPAPTPPLGLSLSKALLSAPGPAQRRAIAKAITLLESTRADHRGQADDLLHALMPHAGKSLRLGISGVPGVGKSTFIEALGLYLVERGHRVAVLTIDPSSSVSGGSILGDKTRMEKLSVHERAFIRPSPAAGNLGGVAEKTREAMLVCEAAGSDVVIVETVGVGQSETAVAGMTDLFVLMQLPNAGDDLQAIKKGVMELADLVVINKADLDAAAATRARAQITSAMRWLGPHAHSVQQVLQLSALHGSGLEEFWRTALAFRDEQLGSGRFAERRHAQDEAWMWERIEAGLKQDFRGHPAVRAALPALTEDVKAGRVAASVAARRLLELHHR
jgi:LAO/AO transport system kinase